MKKLVTIFTAVAMLASQQGFAQTTGMGARSASSYSASNFAWGIGLGMLAIVGVVVGVTVGAATSSSSTSH